MAEASGLAEFSGTPLQVLKMTNEDVWINGNCLGIAGQAQMASGQKRYGRGILLDRRDVSTAYFDVKAMTA
jgi:hypothetical protein